MKNVLRNLFVIGLLCISLKVYAANPSANSFMIDVDTTSVIALEENLSRKYAIFVNPSLNYTVWIASYAISSATWEAGGGMLSIPPESSWTDDYYVYKSTWYATSSSTVNIPLSILEKE